jgi:hypothetical protein
MLSAMVDQILQQLPMLSLTLKLEGQWQLSGDTHRQVAPVMWLTQVTRYKFKPTVCIPELADLLWTQGPVMAYMKKVTSALTDPGYGKSYVIWVSTKKPLLS